MSDGKRFDLEDAWQVAGGIVMDMEPATERIQIAGSIRRKKPDVGDIEILVIPKTFQESTGDLFGTTKTASCLDGDIAGLIDKGVLDFRLNAKGSIIDGEKIKLLRHVDSGIPLDIFTTNEASWWNYMVCRTGPKESNVKIATRAKEMGMKWEPYSSGFLIRDTDSRIVCHSEREVFDAVELPYLPPEERK